MPQPKYTISPHAIKRYCDRIDRKATPGAAARILRELSRDPVYVQATPEGRRLLAHVGDRRIWIVVTYNHIATVYPEKKETK